MLTRMGNLHTPDYHVNEYNPTAVSRSQPDMISVLSPVHGGRQRRRSTLTYTANLTCGDPCQRIRETERGSLQQHGRNQDDLREVYKERLNVNIRYSGQRVSILYFQGRKGSRTVTQACGTESTTTIRGKLDVCRKL